MSLLKDKATQFADKFQNKALKIVAFYSALAGLLAILPAIITAVVYFYFLCVDLYNISTYVKEFRNQAEYSYFISMELVSGIYEEMDTVEKYGVELQETNNGDLWYFTTVEINGTNRPVIYSANVKKKGKTIKFDDGSSAKCHIYIQNMSGDHVWIPDATKHYHQ